MVAASVGSLDLAGGEAFHSAGQRLAAFLREAANARRFFVEDF